MSLQSLQLMPPRHDNTVNTRRLLRWLAAGTLLPPRHARVIPDNSKQAGMGQDRT